MPPLFPLRFSVLIDRLSLLVSPYGSRGPLAHTRHGRKTCLPPRVITASRLPSRSRVDECRLTLIPTLKCLAHEDMRTCRRDPRPRPPRGIVSSPNLCSSWRRSGAPRTLSFSFFLSRSLRARVDHTGRLRPAFSRPHHPAGVRWKEQKRERKRK